jgi:hypothetical protein
MPPKPDVCADRQLPALAPSGDREIVMAYRLKWKTQPAATRIYWLTTGAYRRRIFSLHQDHPA